tara:strand:- start:38 stop:223 length:186 start_codon:yes stop_codon:yes gene_type:complete
LDLVGDLPNYWELAVPDRNTTTLACTLLVYDYFYTLVLAERVRLVEYNLTVDQMRDPAERF